MCIQCILKRYDKKFLKCDLAVYLMEFWKHAWQSTVATEVTVNLFCNELECVMTRQSHPFLFKEITFATRYFCIQLRVEFGQYWPH